MNEQVHTSSDVTRLIELREEFETLRKSAKHHGVWDGELWHDIFCQLLLDSAPKHAGESVIGFYFDDDDQFEEFFEPIYEHWKEL